MNTGKALRWLTLGLVATAVQGVADEVTLAGQRFTIPTGFRLELVAGTNLVQRPVSASVDNLGRLYVTDSSGSNERPSEQLKHPNHRILCLEDIDGDGRYDKATVFAEGVMFPQGCLWHEGSVYVAGPPSIWKFTDTDGDGVADARSEWFKGGTLTGCANDIHGPYLGPDGWIYWTKGAFDEQTHTLGTGRIVQDRAAHIYRARPDGLGLDVVMSGGMDNPVEVAFTAEGEPVFTSTFIDFTQPGRRDGVAHAVYGGVFGKVNGVLDDGRVRRSGPHLMQPFVQFGAGAPSGLCRYTSRAWGPEFHDNLLATLFNLHKVTRHVVRPERATYTSTDSDLVVSDSLDFHPTDVLEDADGSVLIVDTGAWYKLCCPSSQLAKADVLGAIYRLRREGVTLAGDPRGLGIPWAEASAGDLVRLLGDERPWVAQRAVRELGRRPPEVAVPVLSALLGRGASSAVQVKAIEALSQMAAPSARRALDRLFAGRSGATQPLDDTVLLAALRSISVWRDREALASTLGDSYATLTAVLEALKHANPFIRRVAIEAWGRAGVASPATRALLRVAEASGLDPMTEHALVIALVELEDSAGLEVALRSPQPGVQRIALVALDQIRPSPLSAAQTLPLLVSSDASTRRVAAWVAGRHSEWGPALAQFCRERLTSPQWVEKDAADLEALLEALARNAAIQDVLAEVAEDDRISAPARAAVLRAMERVGLKDTPARWVTAVTRALSRARKSELGPVVNTARQFAAQKGASEALLHALQQVGRDPQVPADLRLRALAGLPAGLTTVDGDLFEFLIESVQPARPVAERHAAAATLGHARLPLEQLLRLADRIKELGPMEVPKVLPAFSQATDETLGLRLVAGLQQSKALAGLRAEALRPRLTNFPEVVRRQAEGLLRAQSEDAAKQRSHLQQLLGDVKGRGDVRRGQVIFNSERTACSACHAMGYLGGKVGPDLTSIGQIRSDLDLLEAIVYPSATFVRSYEPVLVRTGAGEEHSGVLRADTNEELILATGPASEVRIARTDIVEMRPGTISVMPQGLDEQLSRQELADLLAFLKNTRWGPQ